MRLEEIINKHMRDLNDTDLVIWKYIVGNRDKARHISIHELARACAVSSTTIVRFAQKLGFDGFGELKAVLKMEEPARLAYSDDVLKDLQVFYQKTSGQLVQRNFDSASKLIHEANRVFAFASGYVQSNVVQELKRLFSYDNVFIFEIRGSEEFRSVMQTGETPTVVEFAQQLKLRDIALISITKLHDNTLASLSTVNLYVSPATFQLYPATTTNVTYLSMMPYFMLLEIWYVKYRMLMQKNYEY